MNRNFKRVESQPDGDEVWDLQEAADFYKVSAKTLWGLARDGKVPCRKVGKQFRFLRSQSVEWMRNNNEQNEVTK